jgi:hypothetical protein
VQLQWRYESRPDLGILALAGRLGAEDVPRLHGAIGWTLYHGAGPLILDLAAVTGWTTYGQGGVIRAGRRLAEAGRTLEIAAAPGPVADLIAESGFAAIRIRADLSAALEAHRAPAEPAGSFRQWRSSRWPHPAARVQQR